MAIRTRNSIFKTLEPELRARVSDVATQIKLTPTEIVKRLQRAIIGMKNSTGICRTANIRYDFNPNDPNLATSIDSELFENNSNVKVNYKLELDDPTVNGVLETVALVQRDKQIITPQYFWDQIGTTGTIPNLDVSFDKERDRKDVLGTWLVEDERIPPIVNGEIIDVSAFISMLCLNG